MAQQAIITTDELEIYRQADSYLVRQKLRNRFIRMGERELRVLTDLLHLPAQSAAGADEALTDEQRKQLIEKFYASGLLQTPGQAVELTAGKRQKKRDLSDIVLLSMEQKPATLRWIGAMSRVMFPYGFPLLLLLTIAAFALMFARPLTYLAGYSAILSNMTPWSLLLLYALSFPCAILHELSHCAACFHYTGDCGRVGLKLYFGIPAFFSDVSSMYTIGKKSKAAAVAFSGVASNLLLFDLFTIIAFFFPQSGAGQVFLMAAGLNLGLALFNLVPFARFDGYWALKALSGVDNLYDKSISLAFFLVLHPKAYLRLPAAPLKKAGLTLYGLCCYAFTYYLWYLLLRVVHNLMTGWQAGEVLTWCAIALVSLAALSNIISATRQYVQRCSSVCQQVR